MKFLTHYYRTGEPPFRSLSALTDSEALRIASELKNETALVYKRFNKYEKYWLQRRETEQWLRNEFIKKGGQPKVEYPHYMVLGTSSYIREGYDNMCSEIRILLSEFSEEEISFTYPGSMVSRWLEKQKHEIYYQSAYHGKVFTLTEILEIAAQYGIPEQEWKHEPNRAFDFFVEAQIWNFKPLEKYILKPIRFS
ncbi:hypothetical protein SD81_000580 [Tolypothrix campylonemoides VB511288]|nr:hypothetical protein SD81_000580 [Tolypothrix campylonemoides VB511288]